MPKYSIADIKALTGVKPQQKNDMILAELRRRSRDRCMIFNPTDQQFVFRWDGTPYQVPPRDKDIGFGKGRRVMDRYLCDNYLKRMIDHLIGMNNLKRVEEENARRAERGMPPMTHHEDRLKFDLRTDDPTLVRHFYDMCWGGVVEEFAADVIDEAPEDVTRKAPLYQQLAEEFADRKADDFKEPGVGDITKLPTPAQTAPKTVDVPNLPAGFQKGPTTPAIPIIPAANQQLNQQAPDPTPSQPPPTTPPPAAPGGGDTEVDTDGSPNLSKMTRAQLMKHANTLPGVTTEPTDTAAILMNKIRDATNTASS